MEKRNLTKLLPAAAVLTAVTITGLKIQAEDQKSVSNAENIMNSEEVGDLLLAAYPAGEEQETSEEKKTEKKTTKTTKKKTGGIKKGSTKALPQKTAESSGVGQGSTSTPVVEVPESGYKDGTYQGSGTGFGGTITVQVTVSGGKISNIDILSAAGETGSYFSSARGVVSSILSAQSPNVDAVSGATYSSNGIIQAVQNALSGAANTAKKTTPTPTPKPSKKPSKTNESTKTSYQDGVYEGQAEGFDGPVTVKITIKNGKIKKITNSNTDTAEFFGKAWKTLKAQILEQQSAEGLDAVSGATYSSNGILGAARAALAQAGAKSDSGSGTTPAPTKAPVQTPTPTPIQTPQIPSDGGSTDNSQSLKDGVYTASAEGFSGPVTITLTVKDGGITDITNTNSDTKGFFKRAWSLIQPEILQSQTADGIDGVSGATYSSNGILNAAKAAIAQARNNGETPQPTSTPVPTETPKPTEAPQPTETPEPTAAPEPTEIPEPTATPEPTAPPDPVTGFYDGTYSGSGKGNDGPNSVRITVTISGGKITSATYDTDDDEDFFIDAWDGILGQIMGKQSADGIDTVSGSTYSSRGIIQAFQSALQQAKGA